jgi:hypothetical protein
MKTKNIYLLLFAAFFPLIAFAQTVKSHKQPAPFDVSAAVESAESMQFLVFRNGLTADGRSTYKKFLVRNSRSADLAAAAKKLKEGREVPQGFRNITLDEPLVEFYVGETCVLRLHPLGDRIICSGNGSSIDLYFGTEGTREVEALFESFIGRLVR